MRSAIRVASAFSLVMLALTLSVQAISQIDHKINIVSLEGNPNKLFSRLVEGKGPYVANPDPGGNESLGKASGMEPVLLAVSVMEEVSSRIRPARRAVVNVTMPVVIDEFMGAEELSNIIMIGSTAHMPVASGVTNRAGNVVFTLAPGNYTILAQYLEVTGNFSITLRELKKFVSVRWLFHNQLEKPLLIQLNDDNGDASISPDESITLFYRGANLVAPKRIFMLVTEQTNLTIALTIVGIAVFPHGIHAVLSPLSPIPLSVFGSRSTLQIGIVWYEVSSNA